MAVLIYLLVLNLLGYLVSATPYDAPRSMVRRDPGLGDILSELKTKAMSGRMR